MQQHLIDDKKLDILLSVKFLVGNIERFRGIENTTALSPFDDGVVDFLNTLSKNIMSDSECKQYPDIVTFAFWIRKASVLKLKDRFLKDDGNIRFGRGITFHIAPSNVPVNYVYSLVTGLITGNINVVRIPSKDFPQVTLINSAIKRTLNNYPKISEYIYLIRYERNQEINDIFSSAADTRIVWGGDNTIAELRKSPLEPRATEITFADRYSMAIINSDFYMEMENKERFSQEFYNDTYLVDQNACTSPMVVVWTGSKKKEARKIFWNMLHEIVHAQYRFQPVMGVNKLTDSYILAATHDNVKIEERADNLIVRVQIPKAVSDVMKIKGNSGYFLECECTDIMEAYDLCNDNHCQTIGYLGKKENILPLLTSGIKGVDRVAPIGRTMDFDFIWDGYNLYDRLTRIISLDRL